MAIACGKAKKIIVKIQNIVGQIKRTQCTFFRQTAHRTLQGSLFSIERDSHTQGYPQKLGTFISTVSMPKRKVISPEEIGILHSQRVSCSEREPHEFNQRPLPITAISNAPFVRSVGILL
jgi:hypothetical protein